MEEREGERDINKSVRTVVVVVVSKSAKLFDLRTGRMVYSCSRTENRAVTEGEREESAGRSVPGGVELFPFQSCLLLKTNREKETSNKE